MASRAYEHLQSLREAWSQRHGSIIQQRRSTRVVDRIVIAFTNGKRAIVELTSGEDAWTVREDPDAVLTGHTADQLPGHVRHALEPRS